MIIDSITKTYGVKTVLSGVSFSLMPGDRLGVVGANGSGKSTLLKIIAGEIEPDSGTVSITDTAIVGYLEQTINLPASSTVDDLLNHALDHLVELESRMRELEVAMSAADDIDPVLAEYGQVTEQFEILGGYEVESRIEAVLDGLGLGEMPRERSIGTLSGGENARVALAGLLVQSPDILLLDEPTNHLDAGMLAWLEGYLRSYRGTVLVVSHDRQFLNRTVNRILAIDEHSHEGKLYTGNYDDYRVMRQQEIERWRREYIDQQAELKALQMALKTTAHQNSNYRTHTDNDKFLYGFRVSKHDSTVSKRVRSVEEKLKRIEADPIPKPPEDLQFEADFDPSQLHGRFALEASGLCHAYGERLILRDINLALRGGDRLVIVGDNGAGKSTLLKILAGELRPLAGEVRIAPLVRPGYVAQEYDWQDGTAFDVYSAGLDEPEQRLKAMLINSDLFRYEELTQPVDVLSAGQKRKLQIARLMAMKANLLILDEPTNHVSLDVVEGLEQALATFKGAVIVATHDRQFIQNFGGDVLRLENGDLKGVG